MIEKAAFANKRGLKKLTALFPFLGNLVKSFRLLKRERPNVVVGVGGYVAAPVLMTAFLLGIPALTIEPNAIPGLANRLLKYFVREVVVAYPETEKFFGGKARRWGVPVRKNLMAEAAAAASTPDCKTVFIFGGSLGAKAINEAVLEALPWLADWKGRVHFVHQTGAAMDAQSVQQVYQKYGLSAEVYPFIETMGTCYGRASFVISRAGGNTVAELAALHKPALLIPYPHAREQHQAANARFLEAAGGARVLLDENLTGAHLARIVREFLAKPELLAEMSERLKTLGGPEAAERIADECLNLTHSS